MIWFALVTCWDSDIHIHLTEKNMIQIVFWGNHQCKEFKPPKNHQKWFLVVELLWWGFWSSSLYINTVDGKKSCRPPGIYENPVTNGIDHSEPATVPFNFNQFPQPRIYWTLARHANEVISRFSSLSTKLDMVKEQKGFETEPQSPWLNMYIYATNNIPI